jgi:predicted amidohydrolase YtcJ
MLTLLLLQYLEKKKSIYVNYIKKYIYGCFFIEKSRGQWILGGGWNIDIWGGGYPEASWLDSILPEKPVCH